MSSGDITLEKKHGRLTVTLRAFRLGNDLSVVITGGAVHVGAVAAGTFYNGMASSSVITIPGHRDDRIAKDAAERISKKCGCNCVVVAGVHYDNITPEEITGIMIMTSSLIDDLEKML